MEIYHPSESQLEILASRFPSPKEARGVSPWNPNQLDIWASEFGRDLNAFHTANYLLAIWNAHNGWEFGPFDAKAAIQVWDRAHRRAFLESVPVEPTIARALLIALGYEEADGVYEHSERQVVFLGDFIDRGPKIRDVLAIARAMVGSGAAVAVMGNHEFNALAFHTENPQAPGVSLRPRINKNIRQHAATISQLNDSELSDALEWFSYTEFTVVIPPTNTCVHSMGQPCLITQ